MNKKYLEKGYSANINYDKILKKCQTYKLNNSKCCLCGKTNNLERHHFNYYTYPYSFIILCFNCHHKKLTNKIENNLVSNITNIINI